MSRSKVRPSPSKSATLYKVGTKKKGQDNNIWIVSLTSNNVKRWKIYKKTKSSRKSSKKSSRKSSKKSLKKSSRKSLKKSFKSTKSFIKKQKLSSRNKIYYVHDNGARPFKVIANNKGLFIYKNTFDPTVDSDYEDTDDIDDTDYEYTDKPILKIKKFIGYWSGYDTSEYKSHGNSILVQLSKYDYIFIGKIVYSFKTNDVITDYVSYLGNSDVPYPVAFGEENLYFMVEYQYISHDHINTKIEFKYADDLYDELYSKYRSRKEKKNIKKIKKKILAKY